MRISRSFSDLSGAVRSWALKADRLCVYEHVGTKTEKVHIHLLMMGVSCGAERLKQIVNESGVVGLKGQKDWSFKTAHKQLGPITDQTKDAYVTYMTKGHLKPMYYKGFEVEYLDERMAAWVEPSRLKGADELLYDKFELANPYDSIIEEYQVRTQKRLQATQGTLMVLKDLSIGQDVLAPRVRSWAFSVCNRIWSVRTASLAKMVFLTYSMRHNVELPNDVYFK